MKIDWHIRCLGWSLLAEFRKWHIVWCPVFTPKVNGGYQAWFLGAFSFGYWPESLCCFADAYEWGASFGIGTKSWGWHKTVYRNKDNPLQPVINKLAKRQFRDSKGRFAKYG